MEWMLLPLKRYAQFSGRSRRMEYWMWVLFTVIVSLVLSLLDSALGLGGRSFAGSTPMDGGVAYGAATRGGLLTNLFALATLIPSLAVAVRRLHDTNRSGWWILMPLLPLLLAVVLMGIGAVTFNPGLMIGAGAAGLVTLICAIVVIVWYCMPGTPGPNDYGDDPLGNTPEDLARTFE